MVCLSLYSVLSLHISAQELPSRIRDYKVHPDKIIVTNTSGSFDVVEKRQTPARIGQPRIEDISITGITLAISAELDPIEHSGEVHFMMFRDFKVNDIPVDVEEYKEPFTFRKNEKILLPKAATIFVPARQILNAAWNEISASKKEWTVTGRVFVFGKFRKLGFSFKRVVPVEVKLTIKNPIRDASPELPS